MEIIFADKYTEPGKAGTKKKSKDALAEFAEDAEKTKIIIKI